MKCSVSLSSWQPCFWLTEFSGSQRMDPGSNCEYAAVMEIGDPLKAPGSCRDPDKPASGRPKPTRKNGPIRQTHDPVRDRANKAVSICPGQPKAQCWVGYGVESFCWFLRLTQWPNMIPLHCLRFCKFIIHIEETLLCKLCQDYRPFTVPAKKPAKFMAVLLDEEAK